VVQSRAARYPWRREVNRVRRLVNGKHKVWFTDDPGGAGTEPVREITVCPRCAANGQTPP
jgi:hypothetical protein